MRNEHFKIIIMIEKINKILEKLPSEYRVMNANFSRVWKSIQELKGAIKESNERIDRLEKTTREECERVRKSIQELKETVNRLIIASEKSEKVNKQTRKKLETLSDNFGYLLEDRAIKHLPKLLKEKFNAEVIEPIRRIIEVNIYGRIRINDEEFILIGETKTRLTKKEIEKFINKCNEIGGRQFRILISYVLQPQFEEIVENDNIKFINSYEIEI